MKYIIWRRGRLLKHKKRNVLIIILILICISAYFYKVYKVNSLYEKVSIKSYKIKEGFESNGLKYTVMEKSIIDVPATPAKPATSTTREVPANPAHKIICVKIIAKNISDKEQPVQVVGINLEYNYMSQSLSLEEYNKMNKITGVTLRPGSVYGFTLPYPIYSNFITGGDLNDIDKMDCNIVFNKYPVKQYVKLY